MTRFVGESLATRSGRGQGQNLGKDRAKNMRTFQETGVHPLIEQARQDHADFAVAALPTLDINRPHVFLDIAHRGKLVGRLIIELFEDLYPVVCSAFRHRCLEGFNTLKGSAVHKLQPQYAMFGGLLQASAATAMPAASLAKRPLQHTQPGLLSAAHDGTQFAITLSRALPLDVSYKVIGRVGKGTEIIADLNDVHTDVDGNPEHPLTIVQCGTTDHRGQNEALSQATASATTATGAVDAMRGNLASTSAGVMDAVTAGLKRKTGTAAESVQDKGAAANHAGAAKKAKSSRGRAVMLDDLGSDDSDEDSADAGSVGAAA